MENNSTLTFGDVRKYCSKIDYIFIQFKDKTEEYGYNFINEVPHSYDKHYLYGFGVSTHGQMPFKDDYGIPRDMCMEFVLSETPEK